MKTSGAKKIAERYVKALFDASASAQPQVETDLETLAALLAENADFRALLVNPLLTREQQAAVMEAVLKKINAHKITGQFIALLARQKRLPLLGDIAALYKEWSIKSRGEMKAAVVSAQPMKDAHIKVIGTQLAKTYNKKILLEIHEDPELLGGLVLKIGGLQLDASLSGKLRRLTNKLKAA